MAAKVAFSSESQSQKVDSIFAKPLINQTLATPAKVFQLFRKLQMDVKRSVKKCIDDGKTVNLYNEIKANIITNGLKYSFATGNWGKTNAAGTRAGVSQVLNRLTYASTLSHLRRLNSPIGREGWHSLKSRSLGEDIETAEKIGSIFNAMKFYFKINEMHYDLNYS
ncbi:hypothetical protein GIB67_010986 [Kingdonia uniflora]|uniref:DNA-directed RNA polymerase n=1 Tax=Kingdonia uniflora TaxID=39325 RepID=A0A7J7MMS1_9MAGN|nr:hypothetical protein GIB67_010986 [Kingdonia uniflora]